MKKTLVALLLMALPHLALATIINVPADQPTIQAGIDAAVNGDTVLVAPDTYNENINFKGKSILLSGSHDQNGSIIQSPVDTLPAVTFNSGEDTLAVIEYLSFWNCNGGAIHISPNSSATIRYNEFSSNMNDIIICGTNTRIISNSITGNMIPYSNSVILLPNVNDVLIRGNIFRHNDVDSGNIIQIIGGSGHEISHNSINVNSVYYGNGVIQGTEGASDISVVNNTISSNFTPTMPGSSLALLNLSDWTIKNNIISYDELGYGVYAENVSSFIFEYNDVYGNELGDYNGLTPGIGCISEEPQFCSLALGFFYLWNTSPCLGTGENGANIGALGVGCGYRAWHVYADGSGDALTIQAAIDSCVDHDSVMVHPGTYTGEGNTLLHADGKAILIKGIAGPENTFIDCEGSTGFNFYDAFEQGETVIDGFSVFNGQSGIYLYWSWPTIRNCKFYDMTESGIVFAVTDKNAYKSDYSTEITGCTFTNCQTGIKSDQSWPAARISNCTFSNNIIAGMDMNDATCINCGFFSNETGIQSAYGGIADSCLFDGNNIAMYSESFGDFSVTYSTIRNGSTGISGGVYYGADNIAGCIFENITEIVFDGGIVAQNCTIQNNPGIIASVYGDNDEAGKIEFNNCQIRNNGDGIYGNTGILKMKNCEYKNNAGLIQCKAPASSVLIEYCLFAGNATTIRTGYSAPVTCINSTFTENTTDLFSVTAYAPGVNNTLIIQNCIIANNNAVGFIMTSGDSADLSIECSDVYNNTGGNYVGIPDQTGLNGNISEDPLFCDAENGDYHIAWQSPCAPINNDCGELMGALDVNCDLNPHIWDVYADGSGEAPTIQAAIDSCVDYDSVMVHPGTYLGEGNNNLQTNGKKIVVKGLAGPDSTIIDCESGIGFYLVDTDEDSNTIIQDISITNAHIGVNFKRTRPTLKNIKFFDNVGFGISNHADFDKSDKGNLSPKVYISKCQFLNNDSAAVHFWETDVPILIMDSCIFDNNPGTALTGSARMKHCHFTNNGVAIKNEQTFFYTSMDSCSFDGNGYAVDGSFIITNSSVRNGGGGIRGGTYASPGRYKAVNCLFENLSYHAIHTDENDSIIDCIIRNCGEIAFCEGYEPDMPTAYFGNCQMIDNLGGIATDQHLGKLVLENCLYAGNCGPIKVSYWHTTFIKNCTMTNNLANVVEKGNYDYCTLTIFNSIISDNTGSGVVLGPQSDTSSILISCSDVYNNTGGNYVGLSDQTGINGNISEDPLFCDTANGDYHISWQSPCMDLNNSCNVLMGAYGPGCDQPQVWNVYVDGSGDAPTIQAAIDSCVDHDTVLVHPGTYLGTGNNNLYAHGKRIVVKGAAGAGQHDYRLRGFPWVLHG